MDAVGVNTQNGVIDTSMKPNNTDLLIYDINKQMYVPIGCGLINLSQFRNDIGSVTLVDVEALVDQAVIDVQTGGGVDLSEYATTAAVDTMFDVYQPSIDLTAYALKTELPTIPTVPTDVNQLTDTSGLLGGSNVDLTGYATEAYVADAIAEVNSGGTIDLSPYALQTDVKTDVTQLTDVNNLLDHPTDIGQLTDIQNLLVTDLATYALKTELFSGDYVDLINAPTIFSGNYQDLSNQPIIPSDIGQLTDNHGLLGNVDLSTYASRDYVDLAVANVAGPDLTTYALKTEIFSGNYNDLINTPTIFNGDYTNLINQPLIPGDVSQLTDNTGLLGAATVDLSGYVTTTALTTTLENYQPTVDLSGYVTHAALNTTLANYQASVDLTPYALASDIPTVPDMALYALKAELHDEPDLTTYVTTTELNNAITLSQNGIITFTDLQAYALTANLPNFDDYVTETELLNKFTEHHTHTDAQFALKTEIPTVPADISDLTDTTGLLTHVDLSSYVTVTALQTAIDGITHPTTDLTAYALKTDLHLQELSVY